MNDAQLRIVAGPRRGEIMDIDGELTVGRVLMGAGDNQMSRRHASFRISARGQITLEDLESANGTFLNGERVAGRQRLMHGDLVRLGTTTFQVLSDGEAASVELPDASETELDEADAVAVSVPVGIAELPPVGVRAAAPVSAPAPQAPGAPPAKPRRPVKPPKPPTPSIRDKVTANRTARRKLPTFPNYTQIPSLLSVKTWWFIRYTGVVATLVVAALAIVKPSTGLRIIWGIGIPLLPILFFLAPGLWRNICPLAASNQTPRLFKFTRALTVPTWLGRYTYMISITLFVGFITARKVGLQTNGPLSGAMLLFALVSAFIGGVLFKGKSGWCSSMCPLLPVQRIYGQTPFALVGNTHCQPCVGCTKNCYDFNPKVAYLADIAEPDPEWSAGRKLFVAAFPGLVLGFFKVPDTTQISVGAMYGQLALYAGIGVLAFAFIDSFVPVKSQRLTTLYGAAAINIFYWFGLKVLVHGITGGTPSQVLEWSQRGVLAVITLFWIYRTFEAEGAFQAQRNPPKAAAAGPGVAAAPGLSVVGGRALSMVGSAQIAGHRRVTSGEPEITFMPDEQRIVAEVGKTVLEVAEANGLPLEVGCRMGVCGADPVGIIDGMDNLSAMSDDERSTLERLGLAANTRMACCCRVKGPVTVSLTPDEAGAPTPSQVMGMTYNRDVEKVVVLGNGIAGTTAADYVRRNHPTCTIELVADEAHHLYNRMGIARLIYGRSAMQGLYLNPDTWCEQRGITPWLNTRATAIDRAAAEVVLGTGERLPYDRLILATGSSSFVPEISGWGTPGTFVLRSADDALAVRAFAQRSGARQAVVAGGGLLGLEAAYALHKLGLATTVFESGDRLLRRQLDPRASEFLRRCLEGIGLQFWTSARTNTVSSNGRLRGVGMVDGRSMAADILIVAAGISPNIALAQEAGLTCEKGVIVDQHMRTSDERILAAGDVIQFGGQLAGLWPNAVEQGKIAAEAAVLETTDTYHGTVPVTVLKVSGVELTSIGQIEPASERDEAIVQEDEAALKYGKLVISGGKIVGAILLGYSSEVAPIASAVKQGWDVSRRIAELRAGRWDVVEQLEGGRGLSSVSVVGIGA